MLKLRFVLPLVFLSLITLRTESLELNSEQNYQSALLNPANAKRILLVGFFDKHIDRIQNVTTSTGYRRRGAYSSSTWSKRITSQIEEQYGLLKLSEWPMTEVGIHCAIYLLSAELSVTKTMESLSKDERVDIVQRMHQFKTEGYFYNDPYYQLQNNMDQMGIEQAHASSTGKNVSIAVIDTGIDIEHPDLAGQITMNKNFATTISASFASDMHGTAVAGIIAARKNNEIGIIGVAPDASIIALKACWPDWEGSFKAICNSFTLALAVNTAIRLGVNILNMSLTGPEDPLLTILLNKAQQKGIFIVVADPGIKASEHRFPASHQGVIPVQAIKEIHSGQELNEKVIKASGDHILTTLPNGTYDFVSGSSLAAAQVSGVIALMLELNPDLKVDQTKTILLQSVLTAGTNENNEQWLGLNAGKAVQYLCEEKFC